MYDAEIELASRVHFSFLPESFSNEYLEIAVQARPHGKLGGDYCSILPIYGNRLVVCMCDAVGHGIASALFAARVNTFVLTIAAQGKEPCELVRSLNAFICRHLSDTGMYTTFSSIYFDLEELEMESVGAAHPPIIHYQSENRKVELLPSSTTFLGIQDPLPVSCSSHRRKLYTGDKVILYTDGLIEAKKADGQFFGVEGLVKFTGVNHKLRGTGFNNALMDEVIRCSGSRIRDDILSMSITVK